MSGAAARSPERGRGRLARLRAAPAGMIGSVAADAQRSRLPQMAAALAYRTIFGLIPVLVVALVGLKLVTTEADIERTLERALAFAGLDRIVVNPDRAEVPPEALTHTWLVPVGPTVVPKLLIPVGDGGGEGAAGAAGKEGAGGLAVETTGSEGLDKWIKQLVGRVSAIPFRTIGVIGLVALLYAAISMLVEIERAFNQIYRAPVGRSWARRVTNYWTMLTLGVLMLFATFYLGEQFKSWADWAADLARRRGLIGGNDSLSVRAIGFAVLVAISTAFLLLAYTVVPNTRVRLKPALAGAFIAALLWEAGKEAFTQYVRISTGYTRLYGSIAILPLFLLWVYVTWFIVLLGLQISYYLQYERHRRLAPEPGAARPAVPPVLDPAAVVAVIAEVARAFRDGRAVTSEALAAGIGAAEGAVRALLERLAARNIVHAVERDPARPAAPEAYTLSRPAESIAMADVLGAGYEAVAAAGGAAADVDPVIDRLRKAQVEAVRGMTVAELIGEARGPSTSAQTAEGAGGGERRGAADGGNGRPAGAGSATLPPVG